MATAGAAALQKATIEAKFTMAMHKPRNMMDVRDRLLEACRRPGFASAALYAKPAGREKIEGLSVRFAEEVGRNMGNLDNQTSIIFEDNSQRVFSVCVTDLETNYSASLMVNVAKTVERKDKRGRVVIDERQNKYGDTVYVVEATDDELLIKQNSLISKAKRNLLLDMLPADIQEEARELIQKTRHGEIQANLADQQKAICDGFSSLGVKPGQLEEYLGHEVSTCSAAQIDDLKKLWTALKTGETNWHAVMEQKAEAESDGKPKESKFAQKKDADPEPAKEELPVESTDEDKQALVDEYQERLNNLTDISPDTANDIADDVEQGRLDVQAAIDMIDKLIEGFNANNQ